MSMENTYIDMLMSNIHDIRLHHNKAISEVHYFFVFNMIQSSYI